jgi:hypothetical protein
MHRGRNPTKLSGWNSGKNNDNTSNVNSKKRDFIPTSGRNNQSRPDPQMTGGRKQIKNQALLSKLVLNCSKQTQFCELKYILTITREGLRPRLDTMH